MEEEKKVAQVPFYVFEGVEVRFERIRSRLQTALTVSLIGLVASNIIWIMVFFNTGR